MTNSISFESYGGHLKLANSQIEAAEAHGIQTGIVCGAKDGKKHHIFSLLLSELDCDNESKSLLNVLEDSFKQIDSQLESLDYDFYPLLPNDSEALNKRAEALSDWCNGFLCGLSLVGITEKQIESKIAKEALEDLSEIAYVKIVIDSNEHEDERAFTEVLEFIRIAVQTIMIELQTKKNVTHNLETIH